MSVELPLLKKSIEWLVHTYKYVDSTNRLMKILYLAENEWYLEKGNTYTEATFVRGYSLPFSKEVHQALQWMDGIEIIEYAEADPLRRVEILTHGGYGETAFISIDIPSLRPGSRSRLDGIELDSKFKDILKRVADTWLRVSTEQLSTHLYTIKSFGEADLGEQLLPKKGEK